MNRKREATVDALIAASKAKKTPGAVALPEAAKADVLKVLEYNATAGYHQRITMEETVEMLRVEHSLVMSAPTLARWCKIQLGRTFGART